MATLLLRLAAPLQSWGVDSKFETRTTKRQPSKSAIIGLLSAAMGCPRTSELKEFCLLRMGVRVDHQGQLLIDFQTAKSRKTSYVTYRHYLCDAVFLVGLEGELAFLKTLDEAVRNPVYPLCLGRRSCPPQGRVSLGIRETLDLEAALRTEPWLASEWMQRKANVVEYLPIITDAEASELGAYPERDVPISFDQRHRCFDFRHVIECDPVRVDNYNSRKIAKPTKHDVFASLDAAEV